MTKTPDVRQRDIDFKVKSLNWQNDPTLKRYNMTINPNMTSIPARVLNDPKLSGGAGMEGFSPKSGKWDLRGYRLKSVYIPSKIELISSLLN